MKSGAPFYTSAARYRFKNRQNIKKLYVFAAKMYLTISIELTKGHFGWFDVNRSTFHEEMRKKHFCLFVPSDLDLCPFHLGITSQFTSVSSKIPMKYELSTAFQYLVNESV